MLNDEGACLLMKLPLHIVCDLVLVAHLDELVQAGVVGVPQLLDCDLLYAPQRAQIHLRRYTSWVLCSGVLADVSQGCAAMASKFVAIGVHRACRSST